MSKTLVITGASRGIGYALAQAAAKEGHVVYALSRNLRTLDQTVLLKPVAIDITNHEALSKWTKQLHNKQVKVDALINNAGALVNKSFRDTEPEDFEAIYRVNVFGLANMTRLLLPSIQPKGHVVNISSMGGIEKTAKFPGLAAYSSSKAAVNILTELLAEEYKSTGPAFNCLALGAVQTEMLSEAFPGFEAPHTSTNMASYILKFALNGQHFFNGKIIPLANSTP